MADKKTEKSKREVFGERMKTKHPDREFADDEALFGQVGDDYDEYERQLGEYRERDEQMNELFKRDPRSAKFITDMARGEDPWIAVIKHLGIDGVTELMNDPEKQEAYAEANKDYAERLAREKELDEEYDRNFAESEKLRDEMDARYGVETVDAALGVINQICLDAVLGKVTPETFEMALKVVRHDADVENARSEGEIAGRNSKIEEKLSKQGGGDGLPAMGGSSTPGTKKNQSRGSLVDYAERLGFKV